MKKSLIFFLLLLPVVASAQVNIDKNVIKMIQAMQSISALYVDSVGNEKMAEDAIRGMLTKLDPHSSYTNAKETREMNEPLVGNFDGIGVQFNIVEDTLLVIQTVHGGPSEKVGVLGGDRIIAVNDTAIAGVKMSRNDIMRRLRGPKGTEVNILIKRSGEKEPLSFNITRDKIPVKSLDAAYLIDKKTMYVRIGSFGATTYDEFISAVDSLMTTAQLKDSPDTHLVLDLQENGGGYLHAAVKIANEFLNHRDLIVYTKGRSIKGDIFLADGDGRLKKVKVTVLVNDYTASASEIVAGAIQDHDRGTIIGRRTFGKGLVQRPLNLNDGSMIRLTVAHYYTPSGRCIQKPYKPGDNADYANDINERLKHGELTCRDSIHFSDSLRYETLKKHRTVYGGGGIMPDVFVPLDTLQYTRFHRMLVAKGIIAAQVLKYFDAHRKQIADAYPTIKAYKSSFNVPQELIDIVIAEGEKQNVKPKDDEEKERTMRYMCAQMKSLIARDLFDESAYFEIMNDYNDIYKCSQKTGI